MALKEILTISGQGGLFKFVSQARNGIIAEHIESKKRMHVAAAAKVSTLEDIAIYTTKKEKPLAEVFQLIKEKENGLEIFDAKSASAEKLKEYMLEVLPEYDKDRVYVSDLKKLFSWYNILQKADMLNFETEEETKVEDKTEEKKEEKLEEVKEKPKTGRKKKQTE